ncbi:MAG: peptide chain release factor N(5)-glutamine methyltransferase [Alphaproteobacteria bacterium]|jgi:release factor glutamine methyltransferase|nr:peptide chain release factor N(5)-glutamine methyltransferase [Alphaproteobacteria bacterium]MBT4711340.1 peptide chain release factor N(5)-glutamine methyltransferase [Alphaproteobacteria bacterium]MBT5859931.1 peptide chain release factor N(5)-glutamine methyltransferase [Alphaproteobacteria bacterium]
MTSVVTTTRLDRPKFGTVGDALERGTARLRDAGVDGPRRDARLLLSLALKASHPALLDSAEPLTATQANFFDSVLVRREAREPMARIKGNREFWGLEFMLSAHTLDPRPDSETLIEAAVDAFNGPRSPRRILDLGTGSGCLLCAALHEFPDAIGIGVDRQMGAIKSAEENAGLLGLGSRASFVVGDWGDALALGTFDLILANPPYIADEDIAHLAPEVSQYDPRAALSGGPDGLGAYRTLMPQAGRLLAKGGLLMVEAGVGQGDEIAALMVAADLQVTETHRDLAGIERCIVATPSG